MIARAIGVTDGVADLQDVKFDKYFWKDSTETTSFSGPVTLHAALGTMTPISSTHPLDDTNVIGQLKTRSRWVILLGNVAGGRHYMLATLFTTDSSGATTGLIANDPWTGLQVNIDPVSKHVVAPTNFPLSTFVVVGYQPVAIH